MHVYAAKSCVLGRCRVRAAPGGRERDSSWKNHKLSRREDVATRMDPCLSALLHKFLETISRKWRQKIKLSCQAAPPKSCTLSLPFDEGVAVRHRVTLSQASTS